MAGGGGVPEFTGADTTCGGSGLRLRHRGVRVWRGTDGDPRITGNRSDDEHHRRSYDNNGCGADEHNHGHDYYYDHHRCRQAQDSDHATTGVQR